MVSVFLTSTSRTWSSARCGKHEVVAAHRRRGLELAVDAPVALLDAARIPGQVEVEEVGAVRLEVESFTGGVGGDQDAQGVSRRIGC